MESNRKTCSLKGYPRLVKRPNSILYNDRQEGVVDFANQIGVYLLYEDRKIVYVGHSLGGSSGTSIFWRLAEHALKDRLQNRWDKFSWFGVLPVKDGKLISNDKENKPQYSIDDIICVTEAVLIESIEPALNRQPGTLGRKKKGESSKYCTWAECEYVQFFEQ